MKLTRLLFLPLFLLGLALAQASAPSLPAQLAPYADGITFAIGLLSAALVHPLTAIFKRLGNTQGPTTVLISGVLSLVISGAFTLWQAAHTHAGTGLIPALLSALTAFIVANGRYLALVQSSVKGANQAMPTVQIVAAPQVLHPIDTPGTEPLHDLTGKVIGAVAPLTPGQPVVVNGLEKI
jgi:hypothetical protein